MGDMKIAFYILGILSAVPMPLVLSVAPSEIVSDATNDDDFSFWVELKMVGSKNWRSFLDSENPPRYGAVLVSDSWILTRIMTFRCLNDPWGVYPCARSTLSNWVAMIGGQQRKVTRKVLHPGHGNQNQFDFKHGVVLVRLDEAVQTAQPVSISGSSISLKVDMQMTIFWKQYDGEMGMMKTSTIYVTPCAYPDDESFCASPFRSEDLSLMEKLQLNTIGGCPVVQYNEQSKPYLLGILMGHTYGESGSVDSYIYLPGEKAKWINEVTKSN